MARQKQRFTLGNLLYRTELELFEFRRDARSPRQQHYRFGMQIFLGHAFQVASEVSQSPRQSEVYATTEAAKQQCTEDHRGEKRTLIHGRSFFRAQRFISHKSLTAKYNAQPT
jgi:hypothetical protein